LFLMIGRLSSFVVFHLNLTASQKAQSDQRLPLSVAEGVRPCAWRKEEVGAPPSMRVAQARLSVCASGSGRIGLMASRQLHHLVALRA
jgi:hypothetical protein